MRRKSERNKGKGSPEKKIEKPTRKSTRRRGKRSPSTSPDRENSNDGIVISKRESEGETTSQSRLPSVETEKITAEVTAESNVTSTELSMIKEDNEETTDAGSVWKVARADASPGEIQKLKLCRQRNMSETSDASSSRKRSNKWHDGGEGITEEIDSADERTTVDSSKTTVDYAQTTVEIDTVLHGRDSSEEVSDSKEFPPEIATAELSDVKPNIDDVDQGETSLTTIVVNAIERKDDKPRDTNPEPSGTTTTTSSSSSSALTSSVNENPDKHVEQIPKESEKESKSAKEKKDDEEQVKEEEEEQKKKEEDLVVREETIIVANSEDNADSSVKNTNEPSTEDKEKKMSNDDDDDAEDSKESSSDDNDKKNMKKRQVPSSNSQRDDTSDDNTEEDDNSKEKVTRATPLQRTTSSRRKHRDKYRDSSNSDSGDSEDEPSRDEKRGKRKEDLVTKKIPDKAEIIVKTNEEEEISRTPEARSETPILKEKSPDIEIKIVENDKEKLHNEEKERIEEIVAPVVNVVQTQNNYKPAKVNLKRSFAARPSVETVEPNKDTTDNETNDLANQDKENHASSEQIDPKSIPKKRRWGTILAPNDPTPAFCVSTDSLKVLVPGAKPLPINEVRLSKDDDEERGRRNQREKRYSVSETGVEHKSRDDGEKTKTETKKDTKGENHIVSRRKISIVKDTQRTKSPSPPAAIPTSILLIKNLVRPFTLNQIRELLSRTGTIVENGFWMDRIKSKCFVEYINEDQAFETRQALHGISWPVSNPKKLQVEYATKEEMEISRELSKDQPTSRKTEPLAANDGWQQDWARDERTNTTAKVTVVREWDLGKEDGQHFGKDKERDKKDLEKKRRQRSRSPTLEAHLPAPARKFKKKEDEPPPAKLLDDLFKKTKATPCIYWLPLTNEQIVVKEEMRRQHMAEHARRLEEMRRAERNRDGRRRRSPRK